MLLIDKALLTGLVSSWKHTNVCFLCLSEGEMTGVCVNATKTCEVLAWCPIEDDRNIPEYVPTLNDSYCKLTLCMRLPWNLEGLTRLNIVLLCFDPHLALLC